MSLVNLTYVHETVSVYFECARCQHFCSADVRVFGEGGSNFLEGDDVGIERARASAKTAAAQTLLFVPCPACGHQPSGGNSLRRRVTVTLLLAPVAVFLVGALAFCWWEQPTFTAGAVTTMGSVALGLLTGGYNYYMSPRPWTGAGERVVFNERR
ncbi:MAG: hypothetical protein R3B40_23640 [Polyangiales bacterium]